MKIEQLTNEIKIETIKGGVAVGGGVMSALTLNEWVALATLVYIFLQILLLIPKFYSFFKSEK